MKHLFNDALAAVAARGHRSHRGSLRRDSLSGVALLGMVANRAPICVWVEGSHAASNLPSNCPSNIPCLRLAAKSVWATPCLQAPRFVCTQHCIEYPHRNMPAISLRLLHPSSADLRQAQADPGTVQSVEVRNDRTHLYMSVMPATVTEHCFMSVMPATVTEHCFMSVKVSDFAGRYLEGCWLGLTGRVPP